MEVRKIQVCQDDDGEWVFENSIVYFKDDDSRVPFMKQEN